MRAILPAMTQTPVHLRCIKPQMIRRYAAYAFDWTLVGVIVDLLPIDGVLTGTLALILLGSVYFSLMEASSYQGTIGKWLVGLRVEDEGGHRLGIPQSFMRFFAASASWATLNIGHLMAHWRADGRTLHDLIARTRVCQERDLETKHHIAVGVLLLVHVGSLLLAVVLAVHKALAMMSSGGLTPPM